MKHILKAPIIEFDTIDSTNNYAMQLLNADKAQTGLTVIAKQQTQGKGQRGKSWSDIKNESVLMSVCLVHNQPLTRQFCISGAIAYSVAQALIEALPEYSIRIKWPNDIILNDKKTAGILIENSIRGSRWTGTVAGIGINVLQTAFSSELPNATSILATTGTTLDIRQLALVIIERVVTSINDLPDDKEILRRYNNLLYRKGEWQLFLDGREQKFYKLLEVKSDGKLYVEDDHGGVISIEHGAMQWKW